MVVALTYVRVCNVTKREQKCAKRSSGLVSEACSRSKTQLFKIFYVVSLKMYRLETMSQTFCFPVYRQLGVFFHLEIFLLLLLRKGFKLVNHITYYIFTYVTTDTKLLLYLYSKCVFV